MKDQVITLAGSLGHVNERGQLKQLCFYSLIPNSTKYALTKDQNLKRGNDEVTGEALNPDLKVLKQEVNSQKVTPVQCPKFSSQRKNQESKKKRSCR